MSAPLFSFVGAITAGAAGLYAIYFNILDEDIADFRVCALPRQAETVLQPTPATSPIGS